MTSFKIFKRSRKLFPIGNIYRSVQQRLLVAASQEILPDDRANIRFVRRLAADRAYLQAIIAEQKTRDREIAATQEALKIDRAKIQASLDRANAIFAAIWEPILVLDRKLRIVKSNQAFDRLFELEPTQVVGQSIDKWAIQALRPCLEDIFEHDSYFKNYAVEQTFEQIGHRSLLLSARRIHNPTDEPLVLLTIVDTTRTEQLEVSPARSLGQN